MEHILICGKRNSGKTELFERLLAACRMPVYGFRTSVVNTREDGYHEIYMFPVGEPDRPCTEENHIGDCNMSDRSIHTEVFDTLGVSLITGKADGILVMDELGFMEAGAEQFCRKVLDALNRETPVLATVRAEVPDVEFLKQIYEHPKGRLCRVTRENMETLYEKLLPEIEKWNERFGC